jgi:hypothetical protein
MLTNIINVLNQIVHMHNNLIKILTTITRFNNFTDKNLCRYLY